MSSPAHLEERSWDTLNVPHAGGLGFAGQLIADASRDGRLSRDYVVQWLGTFVSPGKREDLFRRIMDPATRFLIPAFGVEVGGWWIQVTRRLLWITRETEHEGRLVELLMDQEEHVDGQPIPLAAAEPILIAVPLTRQPVEWAFIARI